MVFFAIVSFGLCICTYLSLHLYLSLTLPRSEETKSLQTSLAIPTLCFFFTSVSLFCIGLCIYLSFSLYLFVLFFVFVAARGEQELANLAGHSNLVDLFVIRFCFCFVFVVLCLCLCHNRRTPRACKPRWPYQPDGFLCNCLFWSLYLYLFVFAFVFVFDFATVGGDQELANLAGHTNLVFFVYSCRFLATLVALHFTPVSQPVSQPVGRVSEKRSLELASLFSLYFLVLTFVTFPQ